MVALGLPEDAIHFLRYPDCGLPAPESAEFAEAAMALAKKLDALEAQTVLAPWRRDPHCDHVATWALLRAARPQLRAPVRWLEYPVWAWEHAATEVAPQEGEADAWRLDVGEVLTRKNAAVARHRSQLGLVISDDPTGFALQPEMLAHFARPWELFLEPRHG